MLLLTTVHSVDDIWRYYQVSCHQIKYDTEYFYGMLVSACRSITSKTIAKYDKDRDGILAWTDIRKDFDHDGSKTLRMENLAEALNVQFDPDQVGGLASYLDRFITALNELEVLEEGEYTQVQKKRMLLTNIRGAQGIAHLTQKCRDAGTSMTFEEMAQYL
jgi:hypothetical protein